MFLFCCSGNALVELLQVKSEKRTPNCELSSCLAIINPSHGLTQKGNSDKNFLVMNCVFLFDAFSAITPAWRNSPGNFRSRHCSYTRLSLRITWQRRADRQHNSRDDGGRLCYDTAPTTAATITTATTNRTTGRAVHIIWLSAATYSVARTTSLQAIPGCCVAAAERTTKNCTHSCITKAKYYFCTNNTQRSFLLIYLQLSVVLLRW